MTQFSLWVAFLGSFAPKLPSVATTDAMSMPRPSSNAEEEPAYLRNDPGLIPRFSTAADKCTDNVPRNAEGTSRRCRGTVQGGPDGGNVLGRIDRLLVVEGRGPRWERKRHHDHIVIAPRREGMMGQAI